MLRIQKDGIAEDGPLLGLFTCMRQILPYISKMDDECDKTVKSVYLSRDNDFLRLEYYWQVGVIIILILQEISDDFNFECFYTKSARFIYIKKLTFFKVMVF